jgi:hypothetical protein
MQTGSSPGCQNIPDHTSTVAANQTLSNIVAEQEDAGESCTSSESGCNGTVNCTGGSATEMFSITETFAVTSTSVTGQIMETITASGLGISLTCNYTFTLTPN